MIRRKIIFKDDIIGKLFVIPEFNGDKEGYEILEEFVGIETLDDFKEASERAQKHYHSFLGEDILPVEEIKDISEVKGCDYTYIAENEKVILI